MPQTVPSAPDGSADRQSGPTCIRWSPGPRRPELDDALHVWSASLEPPPPERSRLRSHLAPDELARAARFRRPVDRHRYVAGRGMLRELLGCYLDAPPAALEFRYGPRGKPALASPWDRSDLRFNLSHTGDVVAFAVVRGAEVGIDLERVRPLPDLEGVAERFFAAAEIRELLDLAPAHRLSAFYRIWTRKEAFVKAVGEGLAHSLSDFAVTFGIHEEPALQHRAGHPEAPDRWTVIHLEPASEVVGAVALPRDRPVIRRWGHPATPA